MQTLFETKSRPALVRPRLSEIISALSYALDLTEGQPLGHSVNSCLIGMHIAEALQLSERDRYDLYFALLLKDTGCSSNASRMFEVFGSDDLKAKREVKIQDFTKISLEGLKYLGRNIQPAKPALERLMAIGQMALQREKLAKEFTAIRCERGAQIALRLGFSARTAQAIRNLDEHWNGKGHPSRARGQEIPVASRIMNIAQTMEVFAMLNGTSAALKVIRERSGTWFDPEVVRAAQSLEKNSALWNSLKDGSAHEGVIALQPGEKNPASDAAIDTICESFAGVIDAKSTFTHKHSIRVTGTAVAIAQRLGFDPERITRLRRAALLHDLGKLSIPNSVVDKSGGLSPTDWEIVQLHPHFTHMILDKIPGFEDIAVIASNHHENLDGSGYHRQLRGNDIPVDSRILIVADKFDAICSTRAHRPGVTREKALELMALEVPSKLDSTCFDALKSLPA